MRGILAYHSVLDFSAPSGGSSSGSTASPPHFIPKVLFPQSFAPHPLLSLWLPFIPLLGCGVAPARVGEAAQRILWVSIWQGRRPCLPQALWPAGSSLITARPHHQRGGGTHLTSFKAPTLSIISRHFPREKGLELPLCAITARSRPGCVGVTSSATGQRGHWRVAQTPAFDQRHQPRPVAQHQYAVSSVIPVQRARVLLGRTWG